MTGVLGVDVSLQQRRITIEHLADWIDPTSLTAALRDAGYRARVTGQDIYD